MLGPSALGRNSYYLNRIFPSSQIEYLTLVSNIGLILYLFIIGMELDPVLLLSHGKIAVSIAATGMIVAFAMGVAVSPLLYDELLDPHQKKSFISFSIFIGTAFSITAFPVLARILKENGLIYCKPGALAMGAAAITDAIAWCI